MVIKTVTDPELKLFIPHSENRAEGLHLSDIYSAMGKELYPKWFKDYPDEDKKKQIRHFEKGLILEEVWGQVFAGMGGHFIRPDPRQVQGVWMSPDGLVLSPPERWPKDYPEIMAPSIHECKVTLKSCNEKTSPISHEKFITWMWQIKGYCKGYQCLHSYLHVVHLLGDYGDRPWTPVVKIHHMEWSIGEIEENWDRLMSYARDIGAPYDLVKETKELGRLPVVNFAAGGLATPADGWLRGRLEGLLGVERSVLVDEAKSNGWSETTLRRASEDLQVETHPIPGAENNRVLWSLPCEDEPTY